MITYLLIDHESRTTITQEADPDDEWDRDNTYTEHYLTGIQFGNEHRYDVLFDGKLNVGGKVYIVYATYSTGDSFGHDDNRQIEFITAHRSKEVAYHNMATAAACNKRDFRANGTSSSGIDYDASVILAFDTGETFKFVPPWNGYFESLTGVNVFEANVGAKNKRRR